MFYKMGESLGVSSIESFETCESAFNPDIFAKYAEDTVSKLKIIAPKAKDFLYFVATMMHAAEAALLDEKGSLRKDAKGNDLTSSWEKKNDSWKWVCADSNVRPFKNANGDIFPEEELVKYYKDWNGKPLCVDHKSDSVEHVKGIIVDTYYDFSKKRVMALCALDKINNPELARKIATKTSTCVSMGTAVTAAICTDCGAVARVEAEFCDHMKYKTGYGEINVGLRPIELSIVVSGADPQAKIKHVMAAANSLANYVSMKKDHLSKQAHELVNPDEVKEIIQDLDKAKEGLDKLLDSALRVEDIEKAEETGDAPQEKEVHSEASTNNSDFKKLANVINGIHTDLKELKNVVSNLEKNSEDKKMADKKAWHQGGGGVNDPATLPYPKEDSDSIREKQDKQMVGATPFPETGGSTGLYPGDEAKKRELHRVAEALRALRRKEALDKAKTSLEKKKAWHQGGGGVNDPANLPYPKEDSDSIREKEDKQMTGEKPFPDVGDINGLYGDDLKKKELVLRAKLSGKFIKAANPKNGADDKANSRWQIYAGDKLILTATVDELTNGKSDVLYDLVATKEFGSKILKILRANDFETAKSLLLKKGQEAPMPPMAADPTGGMPPVATPQVEPLDLGLDAGGKGDMKDELPELLDKAENAIVDVRHGVDALLEESDSKLEGFDELEKAHAAGATSVEASNLIELQKMQKKVGRDVLGGMKKVAQELEDRISELQMIQTLNDNKDQVSPSELGLVQEYATDVCSETREALANSKVMFESFIKYADGTKNLIARAKNELVCLKKTAQDVHLPGDTIKPQVQHVPPPKPGTPEFDRLNNVAKGHATAYWAAPPGPEGDAARAHAAALFEASNFGMAGLPDQSKADDMVTQDSNDAQMVMTDGTKVNLTGDELAKVNKASKKPDLTTKEGRASYREKLAQQALEFSKILKDAHPQGGHTPGNVRGEKDLAHVEDQLEQHKKVMEVLMKTPAHVKSAAEEINKLVVEGKINPTNDFQSLMAQGLDPEAVKYWKQYYGEVDAGTGFASELVKEYHEKKAAEAQSTYEVKLSRAYDITNQMVRKGMISDDKTAVSEQVKEILNFNDSGFESFKRWVEKQTTDKQASMPRVGMLDNHFSDVPMKKSASSPELSSQLDALWDTDSNYKRRGF